MEETKEPIRIGHVIGKWVGGGVEAVVMNYYRHIDRNKIQFDFICDEDSTNVPYEEIEKLGGRVIIVPPYQKVFKYHKELKKILKENKYEIVHSHINTLSVFPLFAAKEAGVPVRIAHSHSTTNKKEWKKNIVKQILRPLAKVFATDYFACSELAGRWLFGNKAFEAGKVYILNNAIDIDRFRFNEKTRDKKRKELNINKDTLVIGHIGRFVAQKNHTFLIDVFNEIVKEKDDIMLILVGQGPLKEEIQEKVKKLGLTAKVAFLGQRNDVNELYQAMDIFILPSLYEGLGMVTIEAQVSGLKCICSNEVPKAVNCTNNVLFVELDSELTNWKNAVLDNIRIKRNSENFEIDEIYNIKKEILNLEKKYIKLVGDRK